MRKFKPFLCFIVLILVCVGSKQVFGQENADTEMIKTGSVLSIKISEGKTTEKIFSPHDDFRDHPEYAVQLGSADSCVSDVDNLTPESRDLGTVMKSGMLNYDLSFHLARYVADRIALSAKQLKLTMRYETQSGEDGIWEATITDPPRVDFFLKNANPDLGAPSAFATRDLLQLVFYGANFADNSLELRFYALGDHFSEMSCFDVINYEGETTPKASLSCTDTLESRTERRMNAFNYKTEVPGLSANDKFKSLELLWISPFFVADLASPTGEKIERRVEFGNDFSATFNAYYEIPVFNHCLDYEVY